MNPSLFYLQTLKKAGATRLSLVKDKAEGKYYVEKSLVVNIEFQKKLFENEIEIHSSLRHRHIIKFIRRTAENSFLMEFASRGNFSMLLNSHPQAPYLLKSIEEFLEGLVYLHSKGLIHNDIKPSNILLTEERTKLADFAFTGRTGQMTFSEIPSCSMVGTDIYVPQNQLPNHNNSVRTDLYACGIILYQAFSGSPFLEKIQLEKIPIRSIREVIGQCLLGGYSDMATLQSELQTAVPVNMRSQLTEMEEFP